MSSNLPAPIIIALFMQESIKRTVDKRIHLAAPLFSPAFFSACMTFQDLCFETYAGWGLDARLRGKFERRRDALGGKWETRWEELFSDGVSDPKTIRTAYREIMDLGRHPKPAIGRHLKTGHRE